MTKRKIDYDLKKKNRCLPQHRSNDDSNLKEKRMKNKKNSNFKKPERSRKRILIRKI